MKKMQAFIILLFITIMTHSVCAEEAVPTQALKVGFDPGRNLLVGRTEITLPPGKAWTVHTGGLRVKSVSSSGRFERSNDTITVQSDAVERMVAVDYEAAYTNPRKSGRDDGIEETNMVSADGIALVRSWYPAVEGLSKLRLTALLPPGFEAISEADEISVKSLPDGTREHSFVFEHPVAGINLAAGRYDVRQERHGAVDIYAYFFPGGKELAEKYLAYTKKYLDTYERLLGPFPYKRFSIVENILPTGYSMPTFTLLGRDVVRLPFIVETSLGHEILHQWFGSSVYVDYGSGNWAEGLTTYLADHRFEEEKGRGPEYRKQILVSYRSYITPEKELSLKEFSSRSDRATASVGYGKTAMVFHMLRNMVGEEAFSRGLKDFAGAHRFQYASWADLQKAFERASGKELDWFFKQWIESKGAPGLEISDLQLRYEGTRARVSFEIKQDAGQKRFLLPVLLKTDKGEIRKTFEIEKETTPVMIETGDMPRELVIDRDYDLFRQLRDEETAPAVSMLLGDEKRFYVIPGGKEQPDSDLAVFLKQNGFAEKKEEELKHDDIRNASMLIPADTDLVRRLFAKMEMPDGDFSLVLKFNPYSKRSVIGIMNTSSPAVVKNHLGRIRHYGKYSILSFKDNRNIRKEIAESSNGINVALSGDIRAVEVRLLTTADQVMEKVKDKEIVYVGEQHDRFEHHRLQYRVIRELYGRNNKIAIGMEMFQKPFQKALDDYISGVTEERTFLKKSEYFKRWGFDYNLYREILLFAREKKIPVIALNIRKEIVSKVSKEGLQALAEEDLKEVPEDMDLSDSEYGTRLREVFSRHAGSEGRNFDFFYQSQVLWDESMAHNLNEFMLKNPGYQVVVLTGSGHMAFGSGIPKRAHRLNGKNYAVILNSDEIEKDVADYLLFPEPLSFTESPKLGVMLKEDDGKVYISGFAPGSAAEEAGLEADDLVLFLDNEKIETVEDIKIHLYFKKKGDAVAVKVRRKRFLLGDKEMEYKVSL